MEAAALFDPRKENHLTIVTPGTGEKGQCNYPVCALFAYESDRIHSYADLPPLFKEGGSGLQCICIAESKLMARVGEPVSCDAIEQTVVVLSFGWARWSHRR